MYKFLTKFTGFFLCLFLFVVCISCQSNLADNKKGPKESGKISVDKITNYYSKHLVISDDAGSTMGFVPDTASKYSIKTKQERIIDIQGEKVPTLLLKKAGNKFSIEYTIDNHKESKRHFRLMVYNNIGIIPFSIHGKTVNFYDVTMKKESSKVIQLDFSLDEVARMSDLSIISIDKDLRNYYVDQVGTIRILATTRSNWLNQSISLPQPDKVQHIKVDKNESNSESGIVLLNKNKKKIKPGQDHNATYIKIVPLNGVKYEQVFLFDINGNVVPFGNKNTLTIKYKPQQAALISLPKSVDFDNKRYFLLTIENPEGAAFQNIKLLKQGLDQSYRNFSYYYDLF